MYLNFPLPNTDPAPSSGSGRPRVVVAMSGGVDSSVAALLLRDQGYEVIGITMRLWTPANEDLPAASRTCCGVEAVDDAQRVAQTLGIKWYLMNMERAFQQKVVGYFVDEYARGRTPHPCVACNQFVKFDELMERAVALGADYLATGHYARVSQAPDGNFRLRQAMDPAKDQSYVLYGLGQEELRRVLLPVGDYSKPDIRRMAQEAGLVTADKPESMEICFIPDNDYRRFLSERIKPEPGPLLHCDGRVLGTHKGIPYYTIGQRQGLGLATGERLYVIEIDRERNTVVVGAEDELLSAGLTADGARFVDGTAPAEPVAVGIKIRYKASLAPGMLIPGAIPGTFRVTFDEPQRSVTPGQPVVLYRGDEVLGGGTIDTAVRLTARTAAAPAL
ncbi:MAG: tRNA 2-thiouridine(34) synthase MnmA [Chloroflexi bacterium]|nr:tRNA 2-thiouridine(34) synthase MnmA [Chloroflexota bacterium]